MSDLKTGLEPGQNRVLIAPPEVLEIAPETPKRLPLLQRRGGGGIDEISLGQFVSYFLRFKNRVGTGTEPGANRHHCDRQ